MIKGSNPFILTNYANDHAESAPIRRGRLLNLYKLLTNLIGSGNPNQAARAHIRPDILEIDAIFPSEEALKNMQVPEELPSARERRALSRWWTEVKAQ